MSFSAIDWNNTWDTPPRSFIRWIVLPSLVTSLVKNVLASIVNNVCITGLFLYTPPLLCVGPTILLCSDKHEIPLEFNFFCQMLSNLSLHGNPSNNLCVRELLVKNTKYKSIVSAGWLEGSITVREPVVTDGLKILR